MTQYKNNLNLSFDKPNFKQKYGKSTGTISEKRKEKEQQDVAEIINASANGVDSIANAISLFTGNAPANGGQNVQVSEPPPSKKLNPIIPIGIGAVVLLVIAFLIMSKNGSTKAKG